ncbi:MAG: M56 family metallopeptidase [Niabella sp.]
MAANLQHILSALGNAILNSFWQMGLLWYVTFACSKLYKKLSAQHLGRISFTALLAGFACFVTTFISSLFADKADVGIIQWIRNFNIFNPIIAYTGFAYLIILIVPVIRFGFGLKNVYTLKHKGIGKVPGYIKIHLLNAVQYLNIKRKVKIFTSNLVQSPLTLGFLKPVILLPVAMLNQLTTQQVEAVILHELAHIKRNDYLQNIATQLILTVFYFNPFARLLVNIQNLEREKAADKWVIQFEYNSHVYASALLQLAKLQLQPRHNLAIHASDRSQPLLERVEWIFGSSKRTSPPLKKLAALFTIAVFAAGFSLYQKTDVPIPAVYKAVSLLPPETASPYRFASMVDSTTHQASGINVQSTGNTACNAAEKNKKKMITPIAVHTKGCPGDHEDTPPPTEHRPIALFINNVTEVTPALPDNEEQKVQQTVAAAKKIIIAFNWKQIDHALAETVTNGEKEIIKQAYDKKMQAADWQEKADLLRRQYEAINWDETDKKLNALLTGIKLDSIYHAYHLLARHLADQAKALAAQKQKELTIKADSLNKKAAQYNLILQKVDSIRNKRTISL